MIELQDATEFIHKYELLHSKKVIRIPYTTKEGQRKTMLMVKCRRNYVSMPYMSVGVLENKITQRAGAKFMLFETEEGNIISTSNKRWEIRDTSAHSNNIYSDKLFLWQNLTIASDLMHIYTSNVRRKIRKAVKDGIEVKHGTSKALIRDFYKVYCHRMQEIRVAAESKQVIYKSVKLGITEVFVAYLKKDKKLLPIGAATLDIVTEDVYANGLFSSLSAFNHHYVSYILHYKMMTYSKEKGAIYYSFGRCTIQSSVHKYKKHFKAEEIPLYWSYSYKFKQIRNNKKLYNLYRKLPAWLTKIIDPIIARHIY